MFQSIVVLSLLFAITISLRLPSHNHEGTVSEAIAAQSVQTTTKSSPISTSTLAASIKPVQLVSNPLALNLIIDDRTKFAQQQKSRLDDHEIDYDSCPITTPFYNGKECITCKNYFNVNLKACVTCPTETVYNPNSFTCEQITYLPNLAGENLLVGDRNLNDWKVFQKRLTKINSVTILECPLDKPHVIKDVCGKCEGEKGLYDLSAGACDKCSVDETYDKDDKKCLSKKFITGLSDIIPTLVPAVPIPHPHVHPELMTPTPVPIPVPVETKPTPAPVQVSVTSKPTPVSGHQKFVTNPETYGFIIDKETLEQYRARYTTLKNQGAEDCPSATAYFDGKQCVGCPGSNGKFQQSTNTCTKCPKGTYYKFALRRCVDESG